MDRILDKAFNRAHGQTLEAIGKGQRSKAPEVAEEDRLRKETAPITAADAIKRINLAFQDNDYFRLLQLPRPEADELGRPVWNVTQGEIAKAYRKLSVFVHPDKNPGEEARQAFERLNQAYRTLKDPDKLEEALKVAAVAAKREQERREASASVMERVALNAQQHERKKELEREQGKSFQDEILQQMRKRQEAAAKRKRMVESSRYHHQQQQQSQQQEEEEEQDGDHDGRSTERPDGGRKGQGRQQQQQQAKSRGSPSSSSDDEELQRRKAAARKRKKPTFM